MMTKKTSLKAAPTSPTKTALAVKPQTSLSTKPTEVRNSGTTRVIVKFNAGYPNTLFIRGSGSYLNWEKGVALKNVKADEWLWETTSPFTTVEFKILLNDKVFESGENHTVKFGSNVYITPKFH